MDLERKLARWLDAGLIDEAARARIEEFERADRKPVVLYALGVLGAGTVALGIISIIAANWGAIPGGVKLACDLLIAVALAAAVYANATRGHRLATEVLVTLFYGFTLASLALVGQVYQLTTPPYRALLVWSACTLPLVLLGRTRYMATLVTAGLACTHGACLQAFFEHLERNEALGQSVTRNAMAALSFASPLLYVVLSRVPWLVRERPQYAQTLGELAWTAVLAGGFALQVVWYSAIDSYDALTWSLAVTAILAGALAAALPRLYPQMPQRGRQGFAAILGLGWLTLAAGTGFARESADFVGAILQVVWLGAFAWTVLQLGLVRAFNTLTALIAGRVLVIYFEVFGSLLSTGLGLITGGALTLLMAYVWRHNTRDLAERLGPSPRSGGDAT